MAAAPTAMKMPRSTRAIAMPISRTFCWYSRGTANPAMMMHEDEEVVDAQAFSVMYPGEVLAAVGGAGQGEHQEPKTTAMPMYTDDQIAASRMVGACGRAHVADEVVHDHAEDADEGDAPDPTGGRPR